MQDLMTRLPGSQSGQPMVAPSFNPQINKPQLATDVQVNKDIIKADKNQQLGLMLHALGGALRGDKNFVQNTMAIQTMQEGKKKKEERRKNYQEFLGTLDPKSPFYSLSKSMGADKLDQLLLKRYEMEQKTPKALFEGQSTTNQFYNTLLQGQQDESIRSTPQYKTAYNYLSQPKTETFLNQQGQQVTRSVPGMISKQDYFPPTGVEPQPSMADSMKEVDEDIVVQVSQERRKDLIKNITVLDNTSAKLDTFSKKIEDIDPGITTVGTERADIANSYTSILLELKNLEELGVLAGPDLDLLQGMLGDPTSIMQNLFKGGAEGTKLQIQNIKEYINEKKTRFSSELGEAIETPQGTTRQETAFLNGRKIIVNSDSTGWIYKDTGEPTQ